MSSVFYNDRDVFFNNKSVEYDSSLLGVEILWDNYGVPHVYSLNEYDAYYGFGWALMKSHANSILRLYARARGRAAEYFGSGELNSDIKIHRFNLPSLAYDEYNNYSQDEKNHIDSFVKGMNDWANSNLSSIGAEYRPILPILPQDVISHFRRVMSLEFSGGGAISQAGSNAYAVGPSMSESGSAMLVINPHLPWSDFYLFFETHLNYPGYNMYGASLIGTPVILLGFNLSLGWAHTVNTIDNADTYLLSLSGSGYVLDGSVRSFNQRVVSIGVRQGNGSIQYQNVTIKESEHGPILRELGGNAYAVRIAGLTNTGIFKQYRDMSKASTFVQFEQALQLMLLLMFNVIYADKDGNIMYLFNGNVPIRSAGSWSDWGGIIPGTDSQYIWTLIHPYSDLPRLANPSTGWVLNANDSPWSCTYPFLLNPSSYPAYMSPPFNNLDFRPLRSINLIRNKASISFNDLVDMKLDTGMEVADRFLPALLAAVSGSSNQTALNAMSILNQWDGRTDTDSVGAVLFSRWFGKLNSSMYAQQWNISNPVTTPSGLSNPTQAVTLLADAANETLNMYGSMSVPWGDVYRFRVGQYNRPGNGADHWHGVYRTMYYSTDSSDGLSYAWHGDTFVSVIEFGLTIKAKRLISYGNATLPGNPFVGSEVPDLSQNILTDALIDKSDVSESLYLREVIYPS